MTLADQDAPVIAWNEPDGLIPRGTVIVILAGESCPRSTSASGGGWPVTPTGSVRWLIPR